MIGLLLAQREGTAGRSFSSFSENLRKERMFEATVRILVGLYVASRCWKNEGTISEVAIERVLQPLSSKNKKNCRTAFLQDCIVFSLLP